jgi:predicted nucleic acid-binding protein
MIILDTNVISELMRKTPDQSVMEWVSAVPAPNLYTTTITQAEILYGIMLLPPGKRRTAFESTAQAMFTEDFAGRILPFGSDAVHPYAQIASARSRAGRPISHFDAQIAAIAYSTGATILSRNTKDFDRCGVKTINPWKSKPIAN